jgi:hypothetical protein
MGILAWGRSDEEVTASFGGRAAAVNTALQRCVAAQFGPLQSDQKSVASGPQDPEDLFDEPIKKTIPDRGHSR